jgi:hypothetical protein
MEFFAVFENFYLLVPRIQNTQRCYGTLWVGNTELIKYIRIAIYIQELDSTIFQIFTVDVLHNMMVLLIF